MSHYNTIMHQLLTLIPRHHFEKQVAALDTDRYVKTFTTWNQFSTMLYARQAASRALGISKTLLRSRGPNSTT